jgi:hypothetical protein
VNVRQRIADTSPALKFVVMVGIMSFFADFTYEGSRSIIGPYLGLLGAGAFAISVISGAGEFLGYGLRLFSGRGADRTGRYWPITIGGYVLQMSVVPLLALAGNWQVAVFYAAAMAVSGTGSLLLGQIFDRAGIAVLIPLTIVTAAYAPLVFLGGFWPALVGASLWGLGMGVQESIIPAAVAPMVSPDRRASAYGLFTGVYGTAWVGGSIVIGALFNVSLTAIVVFSMVAEFASIPLILIVRRQMAREPTET